MANVQWQITGDYFEASRGHMHGFGIDWDDTSGRNNGHFAPFTWASS